MPVTRRAKDQGPRILLQIGPALIDGYPGAHGEIDASAKLHGIEGVQQRTRVGLHDVDALGKFIAGEL
ncbi:hypothetical protein DL768_000752 [Monosporascus sp. mg162]|nr:hypothetical protein DL768_000752 [Monosporascus sp. mg162]